MPDDFLNAETHLRLIIFLIHQIFSESLLGGFMGLMQLGGAMCDFEK